MKMERDTEGNFFNFVFNLCQVFDDINDNYVPYLYIKIKYKSITVYIKNTARGGDKIIMLKGTFHFKYVLKE